MLKAVLFDLGDTVLAEKSYDLVAGYASISAELNVNESLSDLLDAITLGQKNNQEFSVLEWIETRLDPAETVNDAELVELKLWDNTVSLEPINDVENVLKFLRDRSIRVAALSNAIFSSQCIFRELQKHNLAQYFEFVLSSADIGVRKPHRMAFEKSVDLIGLGNSEICYIGDKWTADVFGASSANILPVHFGSSVNASGVSVEHYQLDEWDDFDCLWAELSDSNMSNGK